ncbi:class I SAM-dependent methyltransferase [Chryseolinea lacunae]|uniref:Class I SAM-dependent methyltransferase n=1 Tax=Chryseolinea lacunae TaxID=2801331 RepID=A0ABS1KSL8_9BACT|nr:class I SAM-dependent methyltransferase [Chryseolinea lacunae]MBL0742455.1 class I SAM-dependent methyltransferase [Chryseolinea lacunae]
MRTERIIDSDAALDLEEMQWWDANAGTIEKIWAQNIHYQKAIRLGYLSRMKRFFQHGKNGQVNILEVGCGSGWVGRLVADDQLHIIGTDFSSGQLAIAEKNARVWHKEKFCRYELADASTFKQNVDGVLIHALLHHLSHRELTVFFEQLAQVASGTRIFIYEPVFYTPSTEEASVYDRIINRLKNMLRNFALRKISKSPTDDRALTEAMNKINNDADQNGWYISPKEVPFYDGELEKYLGSFCTLQNKYIVNKTELDIAQAMSLKGIEKPGDLFTGIVLPLASWLDKLSFSGNFKRFIYPHQHLFVCFEWIRK